MQKSGCTAGCGCTNFKADAFKKEKCCNCFHNHILEGSGAPPPAKAPAPAAAPTAAKKPTPPPAGGSSGKCPECDCTKFEPDAFKKDKCRSCFHSHPPGGAEAKPPAATPTPTPPAAGADKKAAADKAATDKAAADRVAAADRAAAADKLAADKAAANQAAKAAADKVASKAAADKAAADKTAADKAAASPVQAKAPRPEEKKAVAGNTISAPAGKNVLKIAWDKSARSEQYQLDVGDIQNLEQLDARLRSKEPALANKKFEYLCRGHLVVKAFWDIFRPEHLLPILFIQDESGDSSSRNRANKAAIPGAHAEKKSGFVAPAAGIGFAVPSKVTFQKPVVKIAVAAAPSSVAKAKAGFKADDAWFASRPALFS